MLSKQLTDFVLATLTEVGLLLKAIREIQEAKRYNPNQPRVPAGSSEGGQWAPSPSDSAPSSPTRTQAVSVGQYDPNRWEMCELLRGLDRKHCQKWKSADCWTSMDERFNNCMRNVYIPELRR